MNPKVRALVEKLEKLEDELLEELHDQGQDLIYQLDGTKVKFNQPWQKCPIAIPLSRCSEKTLIS